MTKKRILGTFLAMVLVLTMVMAFSPMNTAEAKEKYVVAWYADPEAGMNPFNARAHSDYIFIPWIYEPLNIQTWDGDMIPWLAKSWEYNAADMEWVFHLDQRARWSDGKPLTAEDVKFTFETAYKQKTIMGNPTQKYVDAIRVIDKRKI